jgi:hypothetical protein
VSDSNVTYIMQPRLDDQGNPFIYVLVNDPNRGETEEDHEYSFTVESDGWELVVNAVIDSRGAGYDG